jgi:hypothetical protein
MTVTSGPADASPDASPDAAAGVRTLTLDGLPLLVVALPSSPEGLHVWRALHDAGLHALPGFSGAEFPRGARVGVQLEGAEVRVVDEEDLTLLRMARAGLDDGWLEAARRLRGTMFGVVTDLDVAALADPRVLAAALDVQAGTRAAGLLGAIVGVHEVRPKLPLLF